MTATPVKRMIASIIDYVVLLPVGIILNLLFKGGFKAFIASLIVYSIIQIYFWSQSTSIGKNFLGMKVVNKNTGNSVGLVMMFVRETFGKALSGAIFSLGYIWIIIDKDSQGFHDKLVGSQVVNKK